MARRKISFEGLPRLPFEEWEEEPAEEIPAPRRRNIYARAEIPVAVASEPQQFDPRLFFISLGSGSSGNSCYIGTSKSGVIIDAGIRAENIRDILKGNGIEMNMVKGILLTHDHSDHVKYVYTLIRNHRHLKVYCTNRVLSGILRRHSISKRIKDFHVPIFKEIPFNIGELEITAFEVPHDGSDNMGFSITFDSRNFVIATDMGEISARARHYIHEAHYLMIEANYDLRMLLTGRYPEYLKARIQTTHGHMDNEMTASFLKEIITPKLSHIFLCHLSKDNNTPQKALDAVKRALEEKGKKVGEAMDTLEDRQADVQLMALPRFEPTRLFVFRPMPGALS